MNYKDIRLIRPNLGMQF